MAGMFYSLEEVAERLHKTKDQVKELAKSGRLREFQDGSNFLYKVDEVEALMSDTSIMTPPESPVEIEETPEEEIPLELELEPEHTEEEISSFPGLTEDSAQIPELTDADTVAADEGVSVLGETDSGYQLAEDSDEQAEDVSEELSLASEESAPMPELTDADTVAADEGINILGETDSDFQLPEDTVKKTEAPSDELSLSSSGEIGLQDNQTAESQPASDELASTPSEEVPAEDIMGETQFSSDQSDLTASGEAQLAPSDEASLEEIEEDVNLDTFGSGSGLLDLSLQADDTSLGGILDEIYTPEGNEDQSTESASVMDVAADAEQMLSEEAFGQPTPAAMLHAGIEPEPDTMSNAFGFVLLVPFVVVIYTAVVAVAGFNNIMPVILKNVQNMILPIMGGAVVIAGLIIGIPFMMSGGGSDKKNKTKKAKKPKKEKKAKKAKKAKR